MIEQFRNENDRSRHWLTAGALIFFLVVSFFFWGQRALWESSEGRYGEVGREMLASGDWLVPTIAGHIHVTKPPFTYWMIAGGMKIFGMNEWGARFFLCFAFLGTALCVGELAWTAGFKRRDALLAAVIYATGAMTFAAGRVLTTDGFLVFWETLGILGAWKVWWGAEETRSRWRWVFWLAFGMAFLTKGPPGWLPFLAIAAFAAMRRGQKRPKLFAILPFIAFLAVSLSWYLILIAHRPELLEYFLKDELIDRVATTEHHRNAPFYIYFPILLAGLGPWIILWPGVFRRARSSWQAARTQMEDWKLFLVLWILLPLVVFVLAKSRLPLYVLPLFVPIALAFGRVAITDIGKLLDKSRSWRIGLTALASIWVLLMAIMCVAPDNLPNSKSERPEGRMLREAIAQVSGPKTIYFFEMRPHHSLAYYMRHRVLDIGLIDDEAKDLISKETNKPGHLLFVSKTDKVDHLTHRQIPFKVLKEAGEYSLVEIPKS
ncbi:phospholipid carrier-dependent glycosyltransferase [bacterium]|nr:phospholipid carrier-dependent glycosyltransferase [bacterium]